MKFFVFQYILSPPQQPPTDSTDYHTHTQTTTATVYTSTYPVCPSKPDMLWLQPEFVSSSRGKKPQDSIENYLEELIQDFDDCCWKAELRRQRLRGDWRSFATWIGNIELFAASVNQLSALQALTVRSRYFKALRHNGVNYSSVLHLLLKQR